MPGDMSVQRWCWCVGTNAHQHDNGAWVEYADHARIVAEMQQTHAAALAEAVVPAGVWDEDSYDAGFTAAAPRTLTADDPEPTIGSVVLDQTGYAWQRIADYWWSGDAHRSWNALVSGRGPVTLIHDSGKEA